MKKSEIYSAAMLAVVDSKLLPHVKLEVVEQLMTDKSVAEMCEKYDESEENKNAESL